MKENIIAANVSLPPSETREDTQPTALIISPLEASIRR